MLELSNERLARIFGKVGLACFSLAILMEIGAYRYGQQNDLLSQQQSDAQSYQIAQLNNSTEQLRTEAELAKKQAEDEATARVKIEASVAWRHLSDQQQQVMGAALAHSFSNQGVSIWYNASDIEASWFAADIAAALTAAHTLRVYAPAGVLEMAGSGRLNQPTKRMQTGVVVQATKDDLSQSLANAIVHELTIRGFDAARQTDPPFDPNPAPQVWINVEPRPNGPQGEFKLAAMKAITGKHP